jgi:hyperosmotically inducible protein
MQKITLKAIVVAAASLFALSATAQNMHTDSLSSQQAASNASAAPAASASPASGTHVHRTPTRYLADKTISTKIDTKFLADDDLKLRHLKVRTYKGVVHLSGYTETQDQADHAVAVAKDVEGVRSVRSTIKVKAAS